MVQTNYNAKTTPRPSERSLVVAPRTVIIVYEQPKVHVVRHYTKTLIPQVNPIEYEKKYGRVLLDTSTLLALTRRLNIQDNQV